MPTHWTAVLDCLSQLGHILVLTLDGELFEALDATLMVDVGAI